MTAFLADEIRADPTGHPAVAAASVAEQAARRTMSEVANPFNPIEGAPAA